MTTSTSVNLSSKSASPIVLTDAAIIKELQQALEEVRIQLDVAIKERDVARKEIEKRDKQIVEIRNLLLASEELVKEKLAPEGVKAPSGK